MSEVWWAGRCVEVSGRSILALGRHDTAKAFNEPTVLSVNYTPGHALAFLTLCPTFPAAQIMAGYFTQQICQHWAQPSILTRSLYLSLSCPFSFIAGNSPCNTLYISVNVKHFLFCSFDPLVFEEHRFSFCKHWASEDADGFLKCAGEMVQEE